LSNIDAPNSIAVIRPLALGTAKHSALHLAAYIPTARAGPTGVAFILQSYGHAHSLSFVGKLKADRAMRPLVYLLIVGMPNIVVLSNIAHIANDKRLHSCLMQSGDQCARLSVLNILDLMLDLPELPFLGSYQLLPPL
jgi:hypothetical protein